MNGDTPTPRLVPALIAILTAGILFVDWLTPRGWAVWILYLAPLFAAYWLSQRNASLCLAALFSVLTVIGYFISPPGIADHLAIFNRGVGVTIVWASGFLIMKVKEAEEAVRDKTRKLTEQYAELEQLYRTAPVGLALLDRDLRWLRINDLLAEVDGRPAASHMGRTLREVIPEVAPTIEPLMSQVLKTGAPVTDLEIQGVVTSQPGVERDWLVNFYPVRAKGGSVRAVSTAVQDITKRKRTEEAYRQREQQMRLFMEATSDSLWNWDLITGNVVRSSGFQRSFGFSEEELNSSIAWWEERLHPDDRGKVVSTFQSTVASGGNACSYEYRFRRKDGSYAIIIDHVYIVRDAKGKPLRALGAMTDITERKQAETALRESEERLRLALDAAHMSTFDWDIPNNQIICSHWHEELWGFAPGEFAGTYEAFSERVHPEDLPGVNAEVARCMAARQPFAREYRVLSPDGSVHWVLGHGEFMFGPEGQPVRMRGVVMETTGRKRAEEKLLASEVRYRRLFEAAKDGILILDAVSGVIVDVNPFLAELLGVPREEICGKELWELGFFKDIAANKANFLELQQKEYIRYEDMPLENALGRRIHVEFVSNVYQAGPHKVIQCNIRDITERKCVEEALWKSEEKYHQLVEMSHDVIWAVDLEERITFMNQASRRVYGYEPEEMIGRVYSEFITPEQLQKNKAFRQMVLATGGPITDHENEFLRKDGTPVILSTNAVFLRDPNGNIVGSAGTARDITERKRVEDALREAHDRLNTMIQASPVAMIVADLSGIVQTWNPAAEQLFGWTADEVMGRPLPIVPEEGRPQFENLLAGTMKGERIQGLEIRRLRKDGSLIDVGLWSAPIHDANGRIVGMIRKFVDLTERKRAEQAIREANERLIRLSQRIIKVQEEERRHLARELHDEIGQVLTAVFYNLSALKTASGPIMPSRLDDSLAMVDQAIRQVRNLSLDLRPSMLDDLGLAPTIKWYAERLAQRTGLTIHLTAPPAGVVLPAEVKNACFRVAQEAMTNVARHAGAKQVWLELLQGEDEVRLVIRDDGVGFDVTAARRRAARGGSVGLLGMQERVELIGGHFTMDSAPGTGTRIRVRFDLQELAAQLAKMGIAGGGK